MNKDQNKTGFVLISIFTIILLAVTAAALLYIFDIISFNNDDMPADATNNVTVVPGKGTVIIKDADDNVIDLRKEFMWSSTLVVDENGNEGYLSADGGQLGFLYKEELIASLQVTKSIGEIKITKEPYDEPMYTIYDASYPPESINLAGTSDDSVVHYGNELILPTEANEYIIAITVVWNVPKGQSCDKYFFKYIVE